MKIFIILTIVIFSNMTLHSNWKRLNLKNDSFSIFDSFSIQDSVYIIGDYFNSFDETTFELKVNSNIYVSKDYGSSWEKTWSSTFSSLNQSIQNFDSVRKITEIKILNDGVVYAVCKGGLLLKSTNYGTDWDSLFYFNHPNSVSYNDAGSYNLKFTQDNKFGFYSWGLNPNNEYFYYTSDYGESWQKILSPDRDSLTSMMEGNEFLVRSIHFIDSTKFSFFLNSNIKVRNGYLITYDLKTNQWTCKILNEDYFLSSIEFFNDKMLAIGYKYKNKTGEDNLKVMYKSNFYSNEMEPVYIFDSEKHGDTDFKVNKNRIMIQQSDIFLSNDLGDTWEKNSIIEDDIPDKNIVDIEMDGDDMYFAKIVGIWKYDKTSSVEEINEETDYNIEIYPNPIPKGEIFNINLNKSSVEYFNIIDIKGNEIDFVSNITQNGMEIILKTQTKGIYFILIKINNRKLIKKIIVE